MEYEFQHDDWRFPPAEFSPAYFWVLLDKVDIDELKGQLHDMRRHGVRSVCIHPEPPNFRPRFERSCLDVDYLSDKYFQVIRELVQEAADLGMHFWLYDEGGWPSGGASGRVWAINPKDYARHLLMKGPSGNLEAVPQTDRQPNYPDLLNREVTDHFLRLTHEQYYKHCGDKFGHCIRFAFTDEPNSTYTRPGQLTWTPRLPAEFEKRHGYRVEPYLEALLDAPDDQEAPELTRARIDYYDTWSQLLVENYLLPLREWCRKHGLLSSGHMNGEDLPISNATNGFGNILRCMRAMDAPGTDVIWRQLFPGKRTHAFMKYAQSAARQNGSPYAMAECMAIYGSGCTPAETRWVLEHQIVRGATLLVISLYTSSTRNWFVALAHPRYGKEDTLWKYSTAFHDYFTRLCYVMSRGHAEGVSCVVYYAIRDIWAGSTAQMEAIRKHDIVSEELLKRQIDFDYADDDALSNAAVETDDKTGQAVLVIGDMRYQTVVLPTAKWMTDQARKILDQFTAAGGSVIGMDAIDSIMPVVSVIPATSALRVSKRRWDGGSATFLVNQEDAPLDIDVTMNGDNAALVRCNLFTGRLYEYPSQKTEAGRRFHLSLGKWESALFMTGVKPEMRWTDPGEILGTRILTDGWRFRRLVSHEAGEDRYVVRHFEESPQPIALGDWRPTIGDWFSGDVEYSLDFENDFEGHAFLDLGQVNYACQLFLNGECLGQRIWAPYRFDLYGFLRKGTNSLRIIVTNTMANAVNEPCRKAANQARYNYIPSEFDDFYRQFEPDSYPSGLFGPVTLSMHAAPDASSRS